MINLGHLFPTALLNSVSEKDATASPTASSADTGFDNLLTNFLQPNPSSDIEKETRKNDSRHNDSFGTSLMVNNPLLNKTSDLMMQIEGYVPITNEKTDVLLQKVVDPSKRDIPHQVEFILQTLLEKQQSHDDQPILSSVSFFSPTQILLGEAIKKVMQSHEYLHKNINNDVIKGSVLPPSYSVHDEELLAIDNTLTTADAHPLEDIFKSVKSLDDNKDYSSPKTVEINSDATKAIVHPDMLITSKTTFDEETDMHEIQRYVTKSITEYNKIYQPTVHMFKDGFSIKVNGDLNIDANLMRQNGQLVLTLDIQGNKSADFVQKIHLLQERLSQFGMTAIIKKDTKKEA